jgi:hypothetical protein
VFNKWIVIGYGGEEIPQYVDFTAKKLGKIGQKKIL